MSKVIKVAFTDFQDLLHQLLFNHDKILHFVIVAIDVDENILTGSALKNPDKTLPFTMIGGLDHMKDEIKEYIQRDENG